MNLILLGAGIILVLMGLFSGHSVNIAAVLSSFKKDKEAEIKNTVNDSKIAEHESSENVLNTEIQNVPKEESGKSKDEILKFWNKK